MQLLQITSAEELHERLALWLRQSGARHCSALIDVSRYPDAEACAAALKMDADAFAALPNVYEGFAPTLKARGPRLYSAQLDEVYWPGICASALTKRGAGFILHDCSAGEVMAHLDALKRLTQPDGSRRLFRFQDNVVLSMLMPLMTVSQQRSLLGPMRRWQVLDVCGHPVGVGVDGKTPSGYFQPLRLDASQVEELAVRLQPATIIAQANETDGALLHGKTRCEQWWLVQSATQRARGHGLARKEDIALFCILSLQLPADFDQEGPVAQAIGRSKQYGINFGEAIDQVPVEEWRAWDEQMDKMETLR